MKNKKYLIVVIILLIGIAVWHYWDKLKAMAIAARAAASGTAGSAGDIPASAPVVAMAIPQTVEKKRFIYGNAEIIFDYTPTLNNRSAFK